MLDGARISRHARIGWAQTPTLKEELEAVQRFAHDIESAANIKKTKCDLEWNLGNHCMRFDNYVSGNASEAEGVIERLSDKFPKWSFQWSLMTNNRSEENTSELQSLMRISYAVFCLKNKNKKQLST